MEKLALVSFHSTGNSLYLQFELKPRQWRPFREFLHALFPRTDALKVLQDVSLGTASNFHFEFDARGIGAHLIVGAKNRVHLVFHLGKAEKNAVADLLKHTTNWATHFPERRIPEARRAKRKR